MNVTTEEKGPLELTDAIEEVVVEEVATVAAEVVAVEDSDSDLTSILGSSFIPASDLICTKRDSFLASKHGERERIKAGYTAQYAPSMRLKITRDIRI